MTIEPNVASAVSRFKNNINSTRYLELEVTVNLSVILAKEVAKNNTDPVSAWNEFINVLPKTEPRLIIYNFENTNLNNNSPRYKIMLILWCPDTAKVRSKMAICSCKDAVKKLCAGLIQLEIGSCTDICDLDWDSMYSCTFNRRLN